MAVFCKAEGDQLTAEEIKNRFPNNADLEIFNYPACSYKEMMWVFKNAEVVIASRFHAMVIGLFYGKRTYPICYSKKCRI